MRELHSIVNVRYGHNRLRVYSEHFRSSLFTIVLPYQIHNQMSSDTYLFCFDSYLALDSSPCF
jgi:hypothetical protein